VLITSESLFQLHKVSVKSIQFFPTSKLSKRCLSEIGWSAPFHCGCNCS